MKKRERGLRVVVGKRHDGEADEALAGLVLEVLGGADLGDEDLQLRGIERHHAVHDLHDALLLGFVGWAAFFLAWLPFPWRRR